ncbi:MAG: response regulator [Spirochaetaceae bacterium]|jgi:DNA-binding response OmpR family regulator|nr:response regulator [Spirochaetaceae bacterium]
MSDEQSGQKNTEIDLAEKSGKKVLFNQPPIILALDDTPFVLSFIEDVLKHKYDVRLAKTTAAAFGVLNKETVDLILLDIEMPGMSGIEFFEQARKNLSTKYTRVIFITSHSEPEIVQQALKLGACGYLVKPLQVSALLNKVEEVLGQ